MDFYINSYLKVEENLKALGYRFYSLKSFFEFTERNLTTIIYHDHIEVYLGYTDEENRGYFVCRIELPQKKP